MRHHVACSCCWALFVKSVLGAVQGAFGTLFHCILATAICGRRECCPLFTDEETEVQRSSVTKEIHLGSTEIIKLGFVILNITRYCSGSSLR